MIAASPTGQPVIAKRALVGFAVTTQDGTPGAPVSLAGTPWA